MDYLSRHKIIVLTIALQLITLPAVLFFTKQAQDTQTKASAATTIFINPQKEVIEKGQYFSSNIIIDPGDNVISSAHIEVSYDASRVEIVKTQPIYINTDVFPQTTSQPSLQNGTISFSVATDPTKPIIQKEKVATIYFKALEEVERSQIYFGANTKLFDPTNSNTNLLQSSDPEIITISSPSAEANTATFPKL